MPPLHHIQLSGKECESWEDEKTGSTDEKKQLILNALGNGSRRWKGRENMLSLERKDLCFCCWFYFVVCILFFSNAPLFPALKTFLLFKFNWELQLFFSIRWFASVHFTVWCFLLRLGRDIIKDVKKMCLLAYISYISIISILLYYLL